MKEFQELNAGVRAKKRDEAGKLVLGFYTSFSVGNLRATLGKLGKRFPAVKVRGFERDRDMLLTGIENELLDVAIMIGEALCQVQMSRPFWIDPDGRLERLEFTPFVDEEANAGLRAAILGRHLPSEPPRDVSLTEGIGAHRPHMIVDRDRRTFGLIAELWIGETLAFLHHHRRVALCTVTSCFFSASALLTLR